MGIGAPWGDAYIEPQQKNQSYLIFKNKLPIIYQNISRYEPNGPWCPLGQRFYRTQKKQSSLIFIINCQQLIIVTPSPKATAIKKITCYLYPCGFLFGSNIIIASIVVLFDFIKSYHYCSYKYWFTHHI